jgi:hypothetical protein
MISPLQAYLNKQAFQNVATGQAAPATPATAAVPTATPAPRPASATQPRFKIPISDLNAAKFTRGAGVVGNALGLTQSLMHRNQTDEGITYNDPQLTSAAVNAGFGAHNARQLYKLRGGVLNAAAPAVRGGALNTVARGGVMKGLGKAVVPTLGLLSAGGRLMGDNPDRLGASIDAFGAAAPFIGGAIGNAPGALLGEGVSWGATGVNAIRDIYNNRQQTAPYRPQVAKDTGNPAAPANRAVNMQNSLTPDGTLLGANSPTTPAQPPQPTQPTQPGPVSPGGLTEKYAHMNSTELKSFASGFIKAAMQKGVSISDFQQLVKRAVSVGEGLTYDDVRAIKEDLEGTEEARDMYADPSGEAMRNYKAKLLAARDAAAGDIPAVSASLSGLRAGTMGAAAGGGLGALLGAVGKHSGILNIPYKFRSHMPTVGAVGGASLGGVLSALPAAKQKYDTVKALQKLHNTDNLESLYNLGAGDRSILNQ